MTLRIIGGQWRSRQLQRPDTPATRPMPDRLKQAIFNILGSRYGTPGSLPELRVADVFAGSGSMGLEALSRGALRCVFYESGRLALQSLRQNIETLAATDQTEIVTVDAWTTAAHDAWRKKYDLIFLDPPYRHTQETTPGNRVSVFLHSIVQQAGENVPLVVLHHFAKVDFAGMELPPPWTVLDQRTFGTSSVTFFGRLTVEAEGHPAV